MSEWHVQVDEYYPGPVHQPPVHLDVERLEVRELGEVASSALEVIAIQPQTCQRRERIPRHGAQMVALCPRPVRVGLVGEEVTPIEADRAAEALEREVGRSVARRCQP